MLDKDGACGGVPFYFNKKTRGWICGATTYPNFKAWATGAPHERFLPPPKEEENTRLGAAQSFFARIRETAMERMSVREGGAAAASAADSTTAGGEGAGGAAPKMSSPDAAGSLEARAAGSHGGGPLGVLRALGLGGKARGGGGAPSARAGVCGAHVSGADRRGAHAGADAPLFLGIVELERGGPTLEGGFNLQRGVQVGKGEGRRGGGRWRLCFLMPHS